MTERMSLVVNGVEYAGFTQGIVRYSLDAIARSFTFVLADRWFNGFTANRPFETGDAVEVKIYGTRVLNGWIEEMPMRYGPSNRGITISGRSRAGDLVDCSATHPTGAWRDCRMLDVFADLLDPYGLTVSVDISAALDVVKPFGRWAIEDEETVVQCMLRMTRQRGLFIYTDETGNVLISKAGKLPYPFVFKSGVNISTGSRSGSVRQRFSEYTVKGQRAGDDTVFGEGASKGAFTATDAQVERFRPLIMMSEGNGKADDLETRAKWERNTRAGKSQRLTYTVPFFKPLGLGVFPLNHLVGVEDGILNYSGLLLIAGVEYTLTPDDETTTINLAPPEAFDILIPPKKKQRKGKVIW